MLVDVLIVAIVLVGAAYLTAWWAVAQLTQPHEESVKLRRARYYERLE